GPLSTGRFRNPFSCRSGGCTCRRLTLVASCSMSLVIWKALSSKLEKLIAICLLPQREKKTSIRKNPVQCSLLPFPPVVLGSQELTMWVFHASALASSYHRIPIQTRLVRPGEKEAMGPIELE